MLAIAASCHVLENVNNCVWRYAQCYIHLTTAALVNFYICSLFRIKCSRHSNDTVHEKKVSYRKQIAASAAWCYKSFVGRDANVSHLPGLIAMKNLVALSHYVCAHVGGSQIFWGRGAWP